MSNKISLISLIIYLLASCASKKNVIYFQDSEKLSNDRISNLVIFQKDDFLSITVFGVDENTSKLFNTPQLSGSMNKGYSNGSPSMQGYLIDSEGEIDFPVICKIKMRMANCGPENVFIINYVGSQRLRDVFSSYLFAGDGLMGATGVPVRNLVFTDSAVSTADRKSTRLNSSHLA